MKLTKKVACSNCNGTGQIQKPDLVEMRRVREEKPISIRQLAKRLKVSAPFLSDVELGRRACPEHILEAYREL